MESVKLNTLLQAFLRIAREYRCFRRQYDQNHIVRAKHPDVSDPTAPDVLAYAARDHHKPGFGCRGVEAMSSGPAGHVGRVGRSGRGGRARGQLRGTCETRDPKREPDNMVSRHFSAN
jgi:hypothetical protein